jgi:hypothetical protein
MKLNESLKHGVGICIHKDMKTHDMFAFGIIFLFTTKNLLTKLLVGY